MSYLELAPLTMTWYVQVHARGCSWAHHVKVFTISCHNFALPIIFFTRRPTGVSIPLIVFNRVEGELGVGTDSSQLSYDEEKGAYLMAIIDLVANFLTKRLKLN